MLSLKALRGMGLVFGIIGAIMSYVGLGQLLKATVATSDLVATPGLTWGAWLIFTVHLLTLVSVRKTHPSLTYIHAILIAVAFIYNATNDLTSGLVIDKCNTTAFQTYASENLCSYAKVQFAGVFMIIFSQTALLFASLASVEDGYTTIRA